ncbi:MAG: cupin domain-containing protein [Thiobacillus sp.]
MSVKHFPVAIVAVDAPLRTRATLYPEPVAAMLASRLAGRHKRPLGDLFGLVNFGVNLTRLEPGAVSSLRHAHAKQDEFVFVLEGCPTLFTNEGATRLSPGMCAGFRAGTGNAHTLVNDTGEDVVYLEIGDRTPGDVVTYPDDDLRAQFDDGEWTFSHKDGTPY